MNLYHKKVQWLLLIFISQLFVGCGMIQSTRYGNGLKLNTEFFSKTTIDSSGFKKALQKSKARKKQDFIVLMATKKAISTPIFPLNISKGEDFYNAEKNQKSCVNLPKNNGLQESNNLASTDTTKPETKPISSRIDKPEPPMEKHAKLALFFMPITVLALILAIIGLSKIRQAKKEGIELRGEARCITIIWVCSILLFLGLLSSVLIFVLILSFLI